ncbi:ABC transporter substrate-binding protein [Methylomonas sp. DH-1]|uniref:ABC transporter substrate-binding protein n=1 Tax=Methylomonas sp. (strain DH-1) TaxID=1727196 RepID=UPI0007C88C40|nr:ABC transporter substrate binding protein [Methylomonas sp. DH-1]ANE54665.1 hypothetical protein AYM39_05355 [Methylomonas sp. DH-1]
MNFKPAAAVRLRTGSGWFGWQWLPAVWLWLRAKSGLGRGCARICLGFAALCPAARISAADILVLQSHDSAPYRQTVQGFSVALAQRGLHASIETRTVGDEAVAAINEHLRAEAPQLLLALGTPAARATMAAGQTTPVVAGLLLDADELRGKPRLTGVGLDFPPALQWRWLRRLLPEVRHIAVIYDPHRGLPTFEALQQLARADGIELVPAPAAAPEDLPRLLKELPAQLDALWAVDGVAAFNAVAVRELLLYSFRNRTPLIGLSEQWVKAGAIYALDWDYADLGAQAAELAWNILANGAAPSSLPPQTPRKVRVVYNGRTLEHMKLSLPERWLPEISEVAP